MFSSEGYEKGCDVQVSKLTKTILASFLSLSQPQTKKNWSFWRSDTQHDDIWHNDTQHNDTQHKRHSA